MKLDHAAIYAKHLEAEKDFYIKYFGATANKKYVNPRTQLQTYFLSFDGGARLEIMTRPDLAETSRAPFRTGPIHIAFCAGSKEAVDTLVEKMSADGVEIVGRPRTTGDGYYEACVADPEGNFVEITA